MKCLLLAIPATLVVCSIGVASEDTPEVGLRDFKFDSCMPVNEEKVVVKSINILPDPLVFPGPISISFSVNFNDTVDTPFKTEVYLARQMGSIWVMIPCIDTIGSCTYDLCETLSGISECPDPFISASVPCQCPFQKGSYTLPLASFDVESAILPPGNYKGQANLSMNGHVVGCYNVTATFGY